MQNPAVLLCSSPVQSRPPARCRCRGRQTTAAGACAPARQARRPARHRAHPARTPAAVWARNGHSASGGGTAMRASSLSAFTQKRAAFCMAVRCAPRPSPHPQNPAPARRLPAPLPWCLPLAAPAPVAPPPCCTPTHSRLQNKQHTAFEAQRCVELQAAQPASSADYQAQTLVLQLHASPDLHSRAPAHGTARPAHVPAGAKEGGKGGLSMQAELARVQQSAIWPGKPEAGQLSKPP